MTSHHPKSSTPRKSQAPTMADFLPFTPSPAKSPRSSPSPQPIDSPHPSAPAVSLISPDKPPGKPHHHQQQHHPHHQQQHHYPQQQHHPHHQQRKAPPRVISAPPDLREQQNALGFIPHKSAGPALHRIPTFTPFDPSSPQIHHPSPGIGPQQGVPHHHYQQHHYPHHPQYHPQMPSAPPPSSPSSPSPSAGPSAPGAAPPSPAASPSQSSAAAAAAGAPGATPPMQPYGFSSQPYSPHMVSPSSPSPYQPRSYPSGPAPYSTSYPMYVDQYGMAYSSPASPYDPSYQIYYDQYGNPYATPPASPLAAAKTAPQASPASPATPSPAQSKWKFRKPETMEEIDTKSSSAAAPSTTTTTTTTTSATDAADATTKSTSSVESEENVSSSNEAEKTQPAVEPTPESETPSPADVAASPSDSEGVKSTPADAPEVATPESASPDADSAESLPTPVTSEPLEPSSQVETAPVAAEVNAAAVAPENEAVEETPSTTESNASPSTDASESGSSLNPAEVEGDASTSESESKPSESSSSIITEKDKDASVASEDSVATSVSNPSSSSSSTSSSSTSTAEEPSSSSSSPSTSPPTSSSLNNTARSDYNISSSSSAAGKKTYPVHELLNIRDTNRNLSQPPPGFNNSPNERYGPRSNSSNKDNSSHYSSHNNNNNNNPNNNNNKFSMPFNKRPYKQDLKSGQNFRGGRGMNRPRPVRKTFAPPSSTEEEVIRKVIILLNKITPETFDSISNQILTLTTSSENEPFLAPIIKAIFNTALREQLFCEMYASLCLKIYRLPRPTPTPPPAGTPASSAPAKPAPSPFIKLLIECCQNEFQKANRYDTLDNTEGMSDIDLFEETLKIRQRMLGNIKFIGELIKKRIIPVMIGHHCLDELVVSGLEQSNSSRKRNDAVEAVSNFLETIGKDLDRPEAAEAFSKYIGALTTLSTDHTLDSRIRFRCKDIIELRARGWQVRARKQEVGPLKISELHEKLRQKEIEEKEQLAALKKMRTENARLMKEQQRDQQKEANDGWVQTGRRQQPADKTPARAPTKPPVVSRGGTDVRLGPPLREGSTGFSSSKNNFSLLSSDSGPSSPTNRNSNAPVLSSSSSTTGSSASSPPPAVDTQTAEAYRTKIQATMKELYISAELEDAWMTIDEYQLPAQRLGFIALDVLLTEACIGSSKDFPLVSELLLKLQKEKVIVPSDFQLALPRIYDELLDIMIDAPRAPHILAELIVASSREGFLTNWRAIYHALNDNLPSDSWHKVYGPLFERLSKEEVAVRRRVLKNSQMYNPLFLFPSNQRNVSRMGEFIQRYHLQELFPLLLAFCDIATLLTDYHTLDIPALQAKITPEIRAHSDLPYFSIQFILDSLFHYQKIHPEDPGSLHRDFWSQIGASIHIFFQIPCTKISQFLLLDGALDYLTQELPRLHVSISTPFTRVVHYLSKLGLIEPSTFLTWCSDFASQSPVDDGSDAADVSTRKALIDEAEKFQKSLIEKSKGDGDA